MPCFEKRLRLQDEPLVAGYRLHGRACLGPGAQLEMALAAFRFSQGADATFVQGVTWTDLPVVEEEGITVARLMLSGSGDTSFLVLSAAEHEATLQQGWRGHAQGWIGAPGESASAANLNLAEMERRCPEVVSIEPWYARALAAGWAWSATYRTVRSLQRGKDDCWARLELHETQRSEANSYRVHPSLFEGALQVLMATCEGESSRGSAWLVSSIERMAIHGRVTDTVWCWARRTSAEGESWEGEFTLCDAAGRILLVANGVRLRESRPPSEPPGNKRISDWQCSEVPSGWFVERSWRPAETPRMQRELASGAYLVVSQDERLTASLAARLRAAGARPILVRMGEAFEGWQGDACTARFDEQNDARRVFDALRARGETLRGVVFVAGSLEAGPERLTSAMLSATCNGHSKRCAGCRPWEKKQASRSSGGC